MAKRDLEEDDDEYDSEEEEEEEVYNESLIYTR